MRKGLGRGGVTVMVSTAGIIQLRFGARFVPAQAAVTPRVAGARVSGFGTRCPLWGAARRLQFGLRPRTPPGQDYGVVPWHRMSGGPWTAQGLVPEFFHCTGHRSERTSWGKQRYDHHKHEKDFDAAHA